MSATTSAQTITTHSLDGVPILELGVLVRSDEKLAALKLVADSVAQQRQISSRVLIFHPYCLAALAVLVAVARYGMSFRGIHDLGTFAATYAGIIMLYLCTIRHFTSPYIHLAETTNWSQWLLGPTGKHDPIIGAKFGDEIIGALVLRLVPESNKAVIRAWTTRTKFRRRGLGGDMLVEAVKVAKRALGKDMLVEFADDHANSQQLLHSSFGGYFRTRDEKAYQTLSGALVADQKIAKSENA